jgi:predicted RNA-binding Zn ribbon-like protein
MALPGNEDPDTVKLRGGALALDFANSVDWDSDWVECKDEALFDADALGRWGRRLGLTDDVLAVSAAELRAAKSLRAAIHRTFASIAQGEEPGDDDLRLIERVHAAAVGAGRLEPDLDAHDAWRLRWPAGETRTVRFAAVVDAVALLGDADRLGRVTRCPGRDCGWLFLDTSGRRRWCSMDTCGSRAKMRAMYERRRSGATERSRPGR